MAAGPSGCAWILSALKPSHDVAAVSPLDFLITTALSTDMEFTLSGDPAAPKLVTDKGQWSADATHADLRRKTNFLTVDRSCNLRARHFCIWMRSKLRGLSRRETAVADDPDVRHILSLVSTLAEDKRLVLVGDPEILRIAIERTARRTSSMFALAVLTHSCNAINPCVSPFLNLFRSLHFSDSFRAAKISSIPSTALASLETILLITHGTSG